MVAGSNPVWPTLNLYKMAEKFDISKHILVPKHTKLNDDEKKEILEQLNIDETKLPKIFLKDPAVKNLDVVPGDIIKIIRKSPTNLESIFYRVVING